MAAPCALLLLAWLLLLWAPLGEPFARFPEAPERPGPRQEAKAHEPLTRDCGHRRMRIVGGRPAAERKWPWQVTLQAMGKHICGGSLITNRWVLTAAHCIFGHLEYVVKLGDTNLNHQAQTAVEVPVQDIIVHEFYARQGLLNDIALALLAYPVNYSTHVQPVCLPTKMFQVQAETHCWVTGWGRLKESDPKRAAQLQEAEQNIIRHEECNKIQKKAANTTEDLVKRGTVCGYNSQGQGACRGDSGGPLVCEFNETWVQVGIVSWGIVCGRTGYPAVYTEVSFYKEWVLKHEVSRSRLEGQRPAVPSVRTQDVLKNVSFRRDAILSVPHALEPVPL